MESKEVRTSGLKPGMVLAEQLKLKNSILILDAGTVLNPFLIQRIKSKNIESLHIVALSEDCSVPCVSKDIIEYYIERLNILYDDIYYNKGEITDIQLEILNELLTECTDSIYNHINELGTESISIPLCNYEYRFTEHHSIIVAALCGLVSFAIGNNEVLVRQAIQAGLLHDIGKSLVDRDVVMKPGRLSKIEYDRIKEHTTLGVAYLKRALNKFNYRIMEAVLLHHERLDGSGYPYGLKASEIPQLAQIVSVADTCDAMCNKRCYSDGISMFDMTSELLECDSLNHVLVNKLVERLCSYYCGLGVHLSNGDCGYIVSPVDKLRKRPVVHVVGELERDVDLDAVDNYDVYIVDTFTKLYVEDFMCNT